MKGADVSMLRKQESR